LTPGFSLRSAIAVPASVPPDPTADTNPSTLPSVWRKISGPVVRTCASRLATLSNWFAHNAPAGFDLAISAARRPETFT